MGRFVYEVKLSISLPGDLQPLESSSPIFFIKGAIIKNGYLCLKRAKIKNRRRRR